MNAHFPDLLAADVDRVAASLRAVTVVVHSRSARPRSFDGAAASGQGAGIIWSSDGTIVTNAHVATGDAATITFAGGRSAEARVVARDKRSDLALLSATSINGLSLSEPVIGEPSALRPGDLLLALGHPLGLEHALTMGVVHAAPNRRRTPYVVADIRLAPGNSGGPLADARGRIVGVNSMIVGGLGVAVSVDAVRSFIAAAAPRPTLGVELRPVRVRVPAGTQETSVGMLVLSLDPKGAAARAGILQGDLLLGHAGRAFSSRSDLTSLLRDAGAGSMLRLDVGRAGKRISCEVILGAAVHGAQRAA